MADSKHRDDLVMYMLPDGNEYQIIDIIPKYDTGTGANNYNAARGRPFESVDMYIYWSQQKMEGHGWTRKK